MLPAAAGVDRSSTARTRRRDEYAADEFRSEPHPRFDIAPRARRIDRHRLQHQRKFTLSKRLQRAVSGSLQDLLLLLRLS